MSKHDVRTTKNLQLSKFFAVNRRMFKELHTAFYYLVYYSMIYLFPIAFIFFLVFTVGLRERDTKLKFQEIIHGIFKKFF